MFETSIQSCKTLTTCSKFVNNPSTSCVRLGTSFMETSDFMETLIQACCNKLAKKLTIQGCNIVISWLDQSCWNSLVTSLIAPSSFLTACFKLVLTTWNNLSTAYEQTCYNLFAGWQQFARSNFLDISWFSFLTCCLCFAAFASVLPMNIASSQRGSRAPGVIIRMNNIRLICFTLNSFLSRYY